MKIISGNQRDPIMRLLFWVIFVIMCGAFTTGIVCLACEHGFSRVMGFAFLVVGGGLFTDLHRLPYIGRIGEEKEYFCVPENAACLKNECHRWERCAKNPEKNK